jgi:tetratricopeptide (TPR) repeat protein
MKPIAAGSIPALLSVLLLSGCGAFVPARYRIEAARRDIHAGQWQSARIELNKVLESKGRHPEAWLLLAEISLDSADLMGAKSALLHAVRDGAKGPELDALRVRMWLAAGKPTSVLQAVSHHTIHLGEPAQTLALARADLALRRADPAIQALRPLLADSSAPAEAHLLMGESLALKGRARAALAELDAASREDPSSVDPALVRTQILESLGQPVAAERALALALQRMPPGEPLTKRVGALIALTELQLAQGEVDAASKTQATLARLSRGAPEAQFLEARIKLARGDRGAALDQLELIVSNAPDFVQARLLLSVELMLSGSLEQAEAQLTRVLQQLPGNLEVRGLLASAELKLNQPDAVLTTLLPILTSQTPEPQLLALAGEAIGRAGDANTVLSDFEFSNKIDPHDETVRLNLAQACLSAAQPDKALQLLEKSSGDDPRRESLLVTALMAARGPRAAGAEVNRLLAARPRTAAALSIAAEYYVEQRDFKHAEASIREALRLDPASLPLTVSLARVELAAGDSPGAQATLRTALAKHSEILALRFALAGALLRTRDFAQARLLLEAARSSSPQVAIELALARVDLAQGDLAKANADLDRAVASQLDRPAVLEQAAMLLLAAKQDPAALERIHALLAANPANPSALILEGDADVALGHSADALRAYALAQRLHPSANLALTLYRQRLAARQAKPQQPLMQWLSSHPTDWRVREVLGEYDLETSQLKPAARELQAVLKQAPDDAAALNNLAWVYGATGDARARPLAEKAYELAPLSPNVNDTLGWILARQGNLDDALPLLAEAVKLDPADPEFEYHYAYTLFKSGRRADARRVLSKLLADSKTFESRSQAEQLLSAAGGTAAPRSASP